MQSEGRGGARLQDAPMEQEEAGGPASLGRCGPVPSHSPVLGTLAAAWLVCMQTSCVLPRVSPVPC